MVNQILLIHPGWQNSGPEHWQTHWMKKFPNAVKVEQKDWMNAQKDEWVATLNETIEQYKDRDIVFVGHSLACPTLVHWAKKYRKNHILKGALLVASPDLDQADFPSEIRGFSPLPTEKLPFKSILVASTNDPRISFEKAAKLAENWGAELVNVGACGHLDSRAQLGEWPEGQELLKQLF